MPHYPSPPPPGTGFGAGRLAVLGGSGEGKRPHGGRQTDFDGHPTNGTGGLTALPRGGKGLRGNGHQTHGRRAQKTITPQKTTAPTSGKSGGNVTRADVRVTPPPQGQTLRDGHGSGRRSDFPLHTGRRFFFLFPGLLTRGHPIRGQIPGGDVGPKPGGTGTIKEIGRGGDGIPTGGTLQLRTEPTFTGEHGDVKWSWAPRALGGPASGFRGEGVRQEGFSSYKKAPAARPNGKKKTPWARPGGSFTALKARGGKKRRGTRARQHKKRSARNGALGGRPTGGRLATPYHRQWGRGKKLSPGGLAWPSF